MRTRTVAVPTIAVARIAVATVAASLGLAAAACSFGGAVEPIALPGPPPAVVLLLPVSGPVEPPLARSVLAAADPALRERGYYVIPADVGLAMLAERGLAEHQPRPAEELAAAARELGADAFLTIRVERWQAVYAPTLHSLDYDVGWQLWSAADGSQLWELRLRATWSWQDEEAVFIDHDQALEEYIDPAPRRESPSPYANDVEAALALHRRAFAHLPPGPMR